ncbi:hypothetical protein NQ314_012250, partial [Rhamnusium bicolor]
MTIKNCTDNTDINIYFHMKNHYKKLRNVKSTIDNSAPQGFNKSFSTPPSSERSSSKTCNFEERHVRNCLHLPHHSNLMKKHSCISSVGTQSETCVRSSSLPPRPITRRHPYEMPHKFQCKSRSQSVGPTSRKDISVRLNKSKLEKKRKVLKKKSKVENVEIAQVQNENKEESESDRTNKSNSQISSQKKEHEYLQFLLRITEDIIVNNFYTNEDIEKVFQNHLEANRDHLKMEKMKAQLVRLCGELNIPYNSEDHFKNENYQSKLTRMMEDKEQNNFDLANDLNHSNFHMLINKHSLSRVTECTEPCNSLDTLVTSTKHPSGTTISSLGNIEVLPCFESIEINSRIEKDLFEDEKTKIETVAHDLLANKDQNIENIISSTAIEVENDEGNIENHTSDFMPTTKLEEHCLKSKNELSKNPVNYLNTENGIYKDETKISTNKYENNEESSEFMPSTDNKVENVVAKQVTFEAVQRNRDVTPEMVDKIETVDVNTCEKYTQVSVSCLDKQCNTNLKLNEYSKNGDYVLINGPMYVLKTLLNSDEKLILYDYGPTTKSVNDTFEGNHPEKTEFQSDSFYLIRNSASKLLNSDYDLTPQRDNDNDSGKYHHLLVDASTSISDLNIKKGIELANLNHDNLLLTENYTLNSNELSVDGQYEIKSYSLPKEVNGSVGLSGYSISSQPIGDIELCDQVTELDASLGGYEIYSYTDNVYEKNAAVINEEISESGEIKANVNVDTEDDTSQILSFRSEKGQNSSRFPNLLNNILGIIYYTMSLGSRNSLIEREEVICRLKKCKKLIPKENLKTVTPAENEVILKYQLEETDNENKYLLISGPVYLPKSAIDLKSSLLLENEERNSESEHDLQSEHNSQSEHILEEDNLLLENLDEMEEEVDEMEEEVDEVEEEVDEMEEEVNGLERWKNGCKKGICSIKDLLDVCEKNPDSILNVCRKKCTRDKNVPTLEGYLEDIHNEEPISQIKLTHGINLGDAKYHFLMVDVETSMLDKESISVDKQKSMKEDDRIPLPIEGILKDRISDGGYELEPNPKKHASVVWVEDVEMADDASRVSQQSEVRHGNVAWSRMSASPVSSATDSDQPRVAGLEQVVLEATAKAQSFRHNIGMKKQHSLLGDIILQEKKKFNTPRKSTIEQEENLPKKLKPPRCCGLIK